MGIGVSHLGLVSHSLWSSSIADVAGSLPLISDPNSHRDLQPAIAWQDSDSFSLAPKIIDRRRPLDVLAKALPQRFAPLLVHVLCASMAAPLLAAAVPLRCPSPCSRALLDAEGPSSWGTLATRPP